jgi:hypothetical protein
MQQAFVGIDVGTSSARAGIFDENGSLLATARHPITVWHEAGSVVEQSVVGDLGSLRGLGPRSHGRSCASRFGYQGYWFRRDLFACGRRRCR